MFKNLLPIVVLLTTATLSVSNAAEVYWKSQPVTVEVRGSGITSEFSGVFTQVVVQHNYFECGYYVEPVTTVVSGTCYDTQCSGSASGQSPAWNAFYSAKKEDKAERLAAAIKGVGKPTAEALVASGVFNSKPRSWSDFKTAINSAVASGAINKQVANLVLSTYRKENMANLGYAGNSCTHTTFACDEVRVIQEGQYVPRTCDNPVEQPIQSKQMTYRFNVSNSVLLPSEQDKLVFNLSGNPEEVTLEPTYYNEYKFSSSQVGRNQTVINVVGAGRKPVALPQNAVKEPQLIPVDANSATLQITVDPSILPANSTERLVVSYQVKSCVVGLLGSCKLAGWDKEETFTANITSAISNIKVTTPLVAKKKGLRMDVDVKIYKQNSIYHNAAPVSKGANKITLK